MNKQVVRVYLKPDAPREEVTRLVHDTLMIRLGCGYDREKKMSYIDLSMENGNVCENLASQYKASISETAGL